jgi:hypothetical protein
LRLFVSAPPALLCKLQQCIHKKKKTAFGGLHNDYSLTEKKRRNQMADSYQQTKVSGKLFLLPVFKQDRNFVCTRTAGGFISRDFVLLHGSNT